MFSTNLGVNMMTKHPLITGFFQSTLQQLKNQFVSDLNNWQSFIVEMFEMFSSPDLREI